MVGAGIIGCAVAYEVARRGGSVRVVDDRTPGMGATQASAGVLAPYIEARDGNALLALAARSLDLFDGFVEGVRSASAMAIGYQRTGTLDVATQEDTMRHFERAAEVLRSRGVVAHLLDGHAARAEEPRLAAGILGGLLIPAHGYVAATELTRALAAAAQRHGATMVDGGRVRRLSRAAGELIVETDGGSLRSSAVVLAAGSWASQIQIEGVAVRVPVRPVRGQLLHLGWNGPPLRRVVWSERCYLVPWENGTLLVGATVEEAGFDEGTTAAGVRDLIEAACELAPHAWTASVLAARAGLRPGTPDEVPIIGPSRALPNVVYATGHYRNGVLLSPLTAHLVADAVLENRLDPMLELTTPQRFGEL